MTWATLSITRDSSDINIVGRPRPTDSIGNSLRTVFNGAPKVPDDMMSMLHALDRFPESKH